MTTKIKNANIKDGAITTVKVDTTVVSQITQSQNSYIIYAQAASTAANSLILSISNVSIANSSYFIKDDTAVNLGGGHIVVTGQGFDSGSQIVVNDIAAISTTFVNSTTLRAEVSSASSGTYNLAVVNSKGRIALKVNGLTYSNTPTWITESTLSNVVSNVFFIGTFQANQATSYANTTALPPNFNLVSANGYYYGNASVADGVSTTYNFNIDAIDAENQETSRTFNVLYQGIHPQWANVSLLLNMNGSAGSTTFTDNSNFGHVGTRQGDAEISTSAIKYGSASGAFPSSSVLYYNTHASFSLDGDFTIEFWLRWNNFSGIQTPFGIVKNNFYLQSASSSSTNFNWYGFSGGTLSAATSLSAGTWYHFALTRDGTTIKTWLDGTQVATGSHTGTISGAPYIGAQNHDGGSGSGTNFYNGYVDDLRIIKGVVRYTNAFTPPVGQLSKVYF